MRHLSLGGFDCSFCGDQHARSCEICPATGRPLDQAHKMGGTVLAGRVRVGEVLAEGGMGVVYRGREKGSREPVAIKFLSTAGLSSREAYDRFLQEARIASRIDHRGIVRTRLLGITQDGTPYMVMDLLRGEDLASRLRRDGRLELDEAIDVIEQVLEALRVVHQAGIVHRDLKPENIFLEERASGQVVVKILDFGVSRLLGQAGSVDRLTEAGRVYGTPHYASPEAARGAADIDHRADVYACGVLLFEMLTGRPPFDSESMARLMVDVITAAPPDPRALRPDVPPALSAVIARCLEKEPADRFQSAGWMLRALRGVGRAGGKALRRSSPSAYRIIRPEGRDAVTRLTPGDRGTGR